MRNLKYGTNEPKAKQRLTDLENRFVVAKREGGVSEMDWEFEVSRCKP